MTVSTLRKPLDRLDDLGQQLSFYARAFAWFFRAATRYRTEVMRLLAKAGPR